MWSIPNIRDRRPYPGCVAGCGVKVSDWGSAMNLWLRLIRVWLGARRRPDLDPTESSEIWVRAWPHDLDVWGHVNGGRYLTLSDLGRLDLFIRLGVVRVVLAERWVLPLASAAVRFRRPWKLFQRCVLRTRILGWDDEWAYIGTDFLRADQLVATVVCKATTLDRSGNRIPTHEVVSRVGFEGNSIQVPDDIQSLLGRSPMP